MWYRLETELNIHERITESIEQAIFTPLVGVWTIILYIQKQLFGKFLKFLKTENNLRQTFNLNSYLEQKTNLFQKDEDIGKFRKLLIFIKG